MGLLKEEVNYRISKKKTKKCLTCDNYIGPSSCEVVTGNISPEAICDRYYIESRNVGKDAEFYKKELKRNQQ